VNFLRSHSAQTLEEESGYDMETPQVALFRGKILDGAWQEAVDTLPELGLTEESGLLVRCPRISASARSETVR